MGISIDLINGMWVDKKFSCWISVDIKGSFFL